MAENENEGTDTDADAGTGAHGEAGGARETSPRRRAGPRTEEATARARGGDAVPSRTAAEPEPQPPNPSRSCPLRRGVQLPGPDRRRRPPRAAAPPAR